MTEQFPYPDFSKLISDPALLADAANSQIMKQGFLARFSWEAMAESERTGRVELTPKTEEWLAARKKFKKKYKKLVKLGLDEGFLEYQSCYECGGELEITKNTESRKWVYDD